MSFDYDRAWRDTKRLARDNRPLLAGIAGIFFFVPYAALLIALPLFGDLPPPGTNLEAVAKAMQAIYEKAWWAFVIVLISMVYGTMAMLALLKLRARPTVGEALRFAAAALPSYLLALVLELLGIELIVGTLALLVGATGIPSLLAVGLGVSFTLQFYFVARFAMTAPVMVLEGERNPVNALRRSWAMTAGRGGKLLGFFALLVVAFLVIAMLVSLVAGLVLAMLSETAGQLGEALFSSAVMTAAGTLFACALAAAYAQLSRADRKVEG